MIAVTAGTAAIASMARVARTLDPDGSRYSSYSKHGYGSLNLGPVTAAPALGQDDSRYSRYSRYSKHGKSSSDSGPSNSIYSR